MSETLYSKKIIGKADGSENKIKIFENISPDQQFKKDYT